MNRLVRYASAVFAVVLMCASLSGCALLMGAKEDAVVHIAQTEAIRTDPTPAPQEPAATQEAAEVKPEVPKVPLEDGDYYVHVDRDSIAETDYGWSFEGDVYVKVGFTPEQINALKVGDSVEGYEVEYLERMEADWTNPASTALEIGEHGAYFWQDRKAGCWYFVMENDYVLREMIGTELFCITAGETELYDAYSPGEGKTRHFDWYDGTERMTPVGSLFDCLRAQDETGYVAWHGPATVTVKDGTVTRVVFEYAP